MSISSSPQSLFSAFALVAVPFISSTKFFDDEVIYLTDENSDEPVTWYDMEDELTIDLEGVVSETGKNYSFALKAAKAGWFDITITASSDAGELAQIPVTLFLMGTPSGTYTWNGTGGKPVSITREAPVFSRFTAVRMYFAQNGLKLHSISFRLARPAGNIDIAFVAEEK